MPSSKVLVATMTQSVASAKADSACRLASWLRELWETNVSTLRSAQLNRKLFDMGATIAKHQPLLATV